MKPVFLALYLLIGSATPAAPRFPVSVRLGARGLYSCEGMGICTLLFNSANKAGFINGEMHVTGSGELILELTPKDESALDYRLTGESFTMKEDFPISNEMCKGLGLAGRTWIPSGSYPMQHDGSRAIINFH